jgi:hypothetical protein
MQHEAIYELYSNVVSIRGDGSNAIAKDANGNTVEWDASAVTTKQNELQAAEDLRLLRVERDKRLVDTDHYGLSDQTMTDAMSTYRQALRDITDTYTSLDDVVWPTKP